jgi:hypothetical protein
MTYRRLAPGRSWGGELGRGGRRRFFTIGNILENIKMQSRKWKCGAAIVCLAIAISQVGCSDSEEADGGAGNESPDKVFAVLVKALDDQEFSAALQCMTEDGGKAMVGTVIIVTSDQAESEFTDEEVAKKYTVVLEKYGVGKKDLEPKDFSRPIHRDERIMIAGGKVSDRAAFATEMVKAMEEAGDKRFSKSPFGSEAKLTDVEIDGDTATATAVGMRNEKEAKREVEFKKVDGKWLVELKP